MPMAHTPRLRSKKYFRFGGFGPSLSVEEVSIVGAGIILLNEPISKRMESKSDCPTALTDFEKPLLLLLLRKENQMPVSGQEIRAMPQKAFLSTHGHTKGTKQNSWEPRATEPQRK